MQIEGSDKIAAIFSIFHDAGINSYALKGVDLTLELDIQYLAERIDPSFSCFKVTLLNIKNLALEPWLDDRDIKPELIKSLDSIFQGNLEVLGGESAGESIQITLEQSKPNLGYCGGVLNFQASSAMVSDEAGKNYLLKELEVLANKYWQECELKYKT